MQETRNNCFGPKKGSTILHQENTDKHECRNVTATYFLIKKYILSNTKNVLPTFIIEMNTFN